MFYDKYLTEKEKDLLEENYVSILECIDNDRALEIIDILENNNIKFINDLIINYLEIFLEKPSIIKSRLTFFKDEIGDSYIDVIEKNLNLLVD